MMKRLLTAGIILLCVEGYSQTSVKAWPDSATHLEQFMWSFSKNKSTPNNKTLIDFDVMDNWKGLSRDLAVSNDGNYFAYSINKMVFNAFAFGLFKVDSLIIQSTRNEQRIALAGMKPGFFSADSKQYIFQYGTSLCFLQLGSEKKTVIKDIASYKIYQNEWLAWQRKDSLILRNLRTGKEKQFTGITEYEFDNSGTWLVVKSNNSELLLYHLATATEKKISSFTEYKLAANGKSMLLKTGNTLQYISLPRGDAKTIWEAKEKSSVTSYSFDGSGKKALFTVVGNATSNNPGIWYYEQGMNTAVLKINNGTQGIPLGFIISEASFTDNGRSVKLSLQAKQAVAGKPDESMAGVEVWNGKDLNLQSVQAKKLNEVPEYIAIVNIENGKLVLLESEDKRIFLQQGDFAVIKKDYTQKYGDRFWEKGEDSCWLVSLKDGSTRLLPTKSKSFWFSPSGNFLMYFDSNRGCHYYSYDLHSGSLKNITADVPENKLAYLNGENEQSIKQGNVAAWIEKDAGVLVYDNYDIWKLDLTGKKPAANITNSFGELNTTMLTLFETDRHSSQAPILRANEPLVFRAFSTSTKQNGFYKKNSLETGTPESLTMGNYFFNQITGCHDVNLSNEGVAPAKAKNVNTWIVQRQSTNDAPNYFATSDFKNFERLTNFQPQKDYQWLAQELISFKQLDGKKGQGILYKPENFDAAKKYPVMIAFYGQFSNNMFQFRLPRYLDQAMATGLTPTWFLNNGYLVFTPDISVTPLKYGPKAFSVIEGAVHHLKALPYVDADGFGYGSHSFSAQFGAYLLTHSKSFNAAAITEGQGYGNPISSALSSNRGRSYMDAFETGREYGNLWENKSSWLDQTTVLNADKAVSPLLLLCNKLSSADYLDQTFQLFNALRRLDKKVWWLNYDNGSHTLAVQKELKDYTIRYTQFFDHYLKKAPAPQWMTQGVPLKLKRIESRYALDPAGTCSSANGQPCFICEAWNQQYRRTPEMFQREIKDWKLDNDIATELEHKTKERRRQLDKEGAIQTKEVMEMLSKNK